MAKAIDKSINVQHINKYNLRHSFEETNVVLKKGNTQTHSIAFVIIPLKMNVTEEIKNTRILPDNVIQSLIKDNIINVVENIESVYHCGKLKDFKKYESMISKLPQRKRDIVEGLDPHFRYYIMTVERQKELFPMNVCKTEQLSWLSAIKRCGSEYGMVVKIKKENNI